MERSCSSRSRPRHLADEPRLSCWELLKARFSRWTSSCAGIRPPCLSGPLRPAHAIRGCPIEKVDEETFIASVVVEPTFEDVLAFACHYDLNEVARIYRLMREGGELKPIIATECGQMLANIEIGFARASEASRD